MKTVTIKPRFSETDALGHINNTSVDIWFEAARVEYLTELVTSDAASWVVASLRLDYRGESFFGMPVTVDLAIGRLGNSSFTVVCRMYQDGQLRIEGEAVMVHVDKATRKPAPVPQELRSVLEAEIQPLPER